MKELIKNSKKERHIRNTKDYIKNNKKMIQVKEITYESKSQQHDNLNHYLKSTRVIPEFIESINEDPVRLETYKELVNGNNN